MGAFRFSRLAEADLLSIADYTLRTWGGTQTIRYIDKLEAFYQLLADSPNVGRACDDLCSGPYRKEQGSHVIFYRRERTGVSFPAFSTSGCCRERMFSAMKIKHN